MPTVVCGVDDYSHDFTFFVRCGISTCNCKHFGRSIYSLSLLQKNTEEILINCIAQRNHLQTIEIAYGFKKVEINGLHYDTHLYSREGG